MPYDEADFWVGGADAAGISPVSGVVGVSGAGFDTATAGGSGGAGEGGSFFSAGLIGIGLTGATSVISAAAGAGFFATLRPRGRWISETGWQRKELANSVPVLAIEVDTVTADPPVELLGRRAADHCPERQFPAMEINPASKVIVMRCLIFIIVSYRGVLHFATN